MPVPVRITIVMPALNEAALLEASVTDVVSMLRADGERFEVRVVENGSTDGTRTIAERLAREHPEVHVHVLRRPDYGEALRTGMLEAQGDVVVVFDVDYYDLGFVKEARRILDLAAVPTGPVMVVASKRAPGARDERSSLRRAGTATFSWLVRRGFGLHVGDTHGMKALAREALDPLVRSCRMGADLFDTELVLRAERVGLVVAEVPVTVAEQRPSRTSLARRVPRTLVGLVRLRIVLRRDGTRR